MAGQPEGVSEMSRRDELRQHIALVIPNSTCHATGQQNNFLFILTSIVQERWNT